MMHPENTNAVTAHHYTKAFTLRALLKEEIGPEARELAERYLVWLPDGSRQGLAWLKDEDWIALAEYCVRYLQSGKDLQYLLKEYEAEVRVAG